MADFVFNIAKGKIAYYCGLPATNDGLVLVLCQSASLETDATLKDYDDLSTLLAGTTNEMTFTGYARYVNATSVTVTVDDTNDRVDIDQPDPGAYTNTGGAAQGCGKAILCYDPDTTTGTDSTLVPLFAYDCVISFDVGVATTVAFNSAGVGRAA